MGTAAQVDTQLGLALYRQMLVIRKFEEAAVELFSKGLITGSTHPCIGQEAIAVGACSALHKSDLALATYRGHGVALAKGCDPKPLMAELLTRETGCCKGRGGSMHVCDLANGLLGTNAIVAGHIPIAGGVALASKLRHTNQVTACFFGDGAACEGEFFETMNMASLWKLPLLMLCENNGWAISVPVSQSQSTPDIADRARGFGMPGMVVDGNDVMAVREAVLEAAAGARAGRGPVLIECKTVRWERHSAFSSGKYANPDEAQRWRKVDPIPRFAEQLARWGLEPGALARENAAAAGMVQEAIDFAVNSPHPKAESVYHGIYAERVESNDRVESNGGTDPKRQPDTGPSGSSSA
jgi:acetoin:2,6-dichlorophenolindophenol oxidoreductase subunit alpha